MSIRLKVILPYLILTILVALIGVYVVTQLVSSSLNERLTNQLLEAGRVVSDDLARQELKHIESARLIAFTSGVSEMLASGETQDLGELITPTISGLDIENVYIYGRDGEELHLTQRPDGGLGTFSGHEFPALDRLIEQILTENNADSPPLRLLDKEPVNLQYYYFTAIPIALEGEVVGVAVVGTSLKVLLPYFRNTSLANVIIYDQAGQVIGVSFETEGEEASFIQDLAITTEDYQTIENSPKLVSGETISVANREYRLARGILRVSGSELGAFAVALPMEFVLETTSINRNTYMGIFAVAMLVVVVIGFLISRLITTPLFSLVKTSQAITAGDLTKRSGIKSTDEFGTLASTFDEMTERLLMHARELERNNKLLEQMDQAKASFIQIAAHELRTPLTLINGYAQMLRGMATDNEQMDALSTGILDGYERMSNIVDNMLDVSKIDSQTLKITPGTVQFNMVINRLEKEFESATTERKITIQREGIDELPIIKADPKLIRKAFYHLIINAIKYTPDGGNIAIRGKVFSNNSKQAGIEIIIEDTGIGIASEHQALIFEKFYQTGEILLHSSGKTNFKGGGPGLGLAIVQGIIQAHKGNVWVESPGYDETTNPGSKFFVQLPLEFNA